MNRDTTDFRTIRPASRISYLAAIGLLISGCSTDELLEVTDPDIVLPDNLSGPAAVNTVYMGALGDFALAYNSGTADAQVSTVGLMTDEFFHSGTFPTRQEFERRQSDIRNGTLNAVFRNLQRARRVTEDAARFIKLNSPNPDTDPRVAEMYSLAGFSYVFAAENYCSGVPYSRIEGGELLYGGPQTTIQSLDLAIERFDSALAQAARAKSPTQEWLARVGKGRALLNKGDFAGAAAAAAPVPTSFVYRYRPVSFIVSSIR
ncbi:hypothetical protein HRbin33_01658 [bacterium HR33]|nr:hypothetical protein HRbin33_01658 [bacterium HR33]